MPAVTLSRPVWRRFEERFLARAAAWVRSGGHALVVREGGKLDMLLGVDERGRITEAALWSILALEQERRKKLKDGPAAGLVLARVDEHAESATLDWCERDSVHPRATRKLKLDCLACGACCHEANVILYDTDLERFRRAGRPEMTTRSYIKRSRDGKITLRFLKNGRCQNLAPDNKCFVYDCRPHNCRVFPMASEACLAARESTFGWRDGAPEIR
jgi:Fe-S-cluster containining protein